MNPTDIVNAFHSLSTKKCTDHSIVDSLLDTANRPVTVLTLEKGTVLYLSRDKRLPADNDVVTAALSLEYFLHTEDPAPKYVPSYVHNKKRYKEIGERRFYTNRFYSKVVLDRDIRLLDRRQSISKEYMLLKNSILNVDGVVVSKKSDPNIVSLYIDNVLDFCTVVVKRIRPMSRHRYYEAKKQKYSDRDARILEQCTKE